ncbi:MAG: hypothetical protein EG826_02730 [Deltaproteobacteria bacterium]|nr:hypothetical protein [Deltaproteobacteria bacterium]
MDLEDLLKKGYHPKHDHHGRKDERYGHALSYHEGKHHRGHDHRRHKMRMFLPFVRSLRQKRFLLAGVVLLGVVVFALMIMLLLAFIPLIRQGLTYVDANGIKGILDALLPYIDKIWKGNG